MGIKCDVNGKTFTLLESVPVWIVVYGQRIALTVPEGFETDFASIPSGLHWLIPKFGDHNKAAVAHDWLYQHPRLTNKRGAYIVTLDQKHVDGLFLQIMKGSGVSWKMRTSMYLGVRIGGWVPWGKYRKREG